MSDRRPRARVDPAPAAISAANRALRLAWALAWYLLYRPSPTPLFGWRRLLLRCFGARIDRTAKPYPGARIWAPWNLTMRAFSCIASSADCYCVAPIDFGEYVTVSQYAYLCTASHDIRDAAMTLIAAPITLERRCWIAAGAFVGPGVRVGAGAVVAARATVVRDVAAWAVVAGNPARVVGQRPVIQD